MTSEEPTGGAFVRRMMAGDLPAVAKLSEQLGYPVLISDLTDRFGSMDSSGSHYMIVALSQEVLVGWCHVFRVEMLESDGYAELGGIVVDEDCRREGVGRALVSEAESWASSLGLPKIRAHSGFHREAAHEFYRAEGFEQLAPAMFQKCFVDRGEARN